MSSYFDALYGMSCIRVMRTIATLTWNVSLVCACGHISLVGQLLSHFQIETLISSLAFPQSTLGEKGGVYMMCNLCVLSVVLLQIFFASN